MHELKFDGYRTQAHIRDGTSRIYTRRGYDWTDRFGAIAQALNRLADRSAVLDGEIVVLDEQGVSDFHRLQQDLARGRSDRFTYFAFDLLYLGGFDLRALSLLERKRLLADVVQPIADGQIRLSEHMDVDGAEMFRHACTLRAEGIVSKLRAAPYRSGRQTSWLKVKCTKSDNYPIVAFVEKLGAQPRKVASLYVGRREGGRLLYAGKVKTGYTETIARDVRERLDPFVRSSSPLSVPISKPKATWVEPVLDAELVFSGISADGLLREAVFKGIRDDLASAAVAEIAARGPPKRARPASSGRGFSKDNILQLLPDAVVPRRDELAAYWKRIYTRALPHLAHRPLKLVRHVHGTTFYHKGSLPPVPGSVRQLKIHKREGGEGTRLWVEDLAGLLGLLEIGAIELHPWNAHVEDIEHADSLVFDLDPGEDVGWDFVVESALALRQVLGMEGLGSWPKLTGGKGLHLVVPIETNITHDAARKYAKSIAQRLATKDRRRYTVTAALPARAGRIFIDYLRNGRGTTAIGTYSPRARAGFPIAAPVTWKQIEEGIASNTFNLAHIPGRS